MRKLASARAAILEAPLGIKPASRYPRIANMIVRRLRSALYENSDSSMA